MVWETIEDDERELARGVRYTEMKAHFGAVSRGSLYYLLILITFVAAVLVGLWIVFT